MQGAKLVVLVPDAATRRALRSIASCYPLHDMQAAISVAQAPIDACVRETRRTLFDGPLAVLTWSEESARLALAAGADEAFALESVALDGEAFLNLAERARLKSVLRCRAEPRLAALRELEKLCAFGRLATGVAEELNDPLSSALLSLELLRLELEPLYAGVRELRRLAASSEPIAAEVLRELAGRVRSSGDTPHRAHRVLSEVADACASIAKVAEELGLHSRVSEHRELVDLPQTLDKILRLLGRSVGKSTHIEREYARELPAVLAPRAKVAQVLISLLASVLARPREPDDPPCRLRVCLSADATTVSVTVTLGSSSTARSLLESTIAPLGSTLGTLAEDSDDFELTVAHSVLQSLGGELLLEASASEGHTVVARFPRPLACEMEAIRPSRPPPAPELMRSILVLEPEPALLSTLAHLLSPRYAVQLASDAAEAQRLLDAGTLPDVVLAASDDSAGRKFVEWLLRERPELTRRLLITTSEGELVDELHGLSLLAKPLEPQRLFAGIEERLRAPLRKTRVADPAKAASAAR